MWGVPVCATAVRESESGTAFEPSTLELHTTPSHHTSTLQATHSTPHTIHHSHPHAYTYDGPLLVRARLLHLPLSLTRASGYAWWFA